MAQLLMAAIQNNYGYMTKWMGLPINLPKKAGRRSDAPGKAGPQKRERPEQRAARAARQLLLGEDRNCQQQDQGNDQHIGSSFGQAERFHPRAHGGAPVP
jgi:hypothetical protein